MSTRIVELVALALVVFCVWDGWQQGVAMKVYHIVKYIFRLIVVMIILPILLSVIPADMGGRIGITFFVSWIVAVIIVEIVAKILGIADKIAKPDRGQRMIGAVLGAVYGVAVLWFILLLLGSFDDMSGYSAVCDWIRKSPTLMAINKVNPLVYLMKMYEIPVL